MDDLTYFPTVFNDITVFAGDALIVNYGKGGSGGDYFLLKKEGDTFKTVSRKSNGSSFVLNSELSSSGIYKFGYNPWSYDKPNYFSNEFKITVLQDVAEFIKDIQLFSFGIEPVNNNYQINDIPRKNHWRTIDIGLITEQHGDQAGLKAEIAKVVSAYEVPAGAHGAYCDVIQEDYGNREIRLHLAFALQQTSSTQLVITVEGSSGKTFTKTLTLNFA